MHIPVLQELVLELFQECFIQTFVDATLGLGGHTDLVLGHHPEISTFIGFDQDELALEKARKRLEKSTVKKYFVDKNFLHIAESLQDLGISSVDAFLFDIGVSSPQLDEASRGFSFLREGPLDMRMDTRKGYTAEDAVNSLPEKELANILYELGEEYRSRPIARAIVEARRKQRIMTTTELAAIVTSVIGTRGKIHPATKVFQALRIYVNDELTVLESALKSALQLLSPKGRLAVITFHSLEDRIVKNIFKEASISKEYALTVKKPLVASFTEKKINPRARSAKLRCIERIG